MKTEDIKITPRWSKNKEDIWNEVFDELDDTPQHLQLTPRKRTMWYYAAAVAAILILLPGISFFYTQTKVVQRGEQLAVLLPDGSRVDLNAESQLSYKPLWWYVSREVKLKGEGYFEVEKGSTFRVHSGAYTVSVLGTSFNIFSRANKFNVTCLTGKVNVSDRSGSVILTPNMQATLQDGKLKAKEVEDARLSVNWKNGLFLFNGVPLKDVVEEIERQYNIEVVPVANLNYLYSGNFTRDKKPEEVLKIIGSPFGIDFKIK